MAPNVQTDPAGWWDNTIDLHPPSNDEVAETMDRTRASFKELGHQLIADLPPGPDAIAAIACNQDHYSA
jgi:hypothetical protein